MLTAASRHYRTQQALAKRTVADLEALWRAVDRTDIAGSFDIARAVVLLSAAQMLAAGTADGYTDAVLAEQGLSTDAAARVNARGFAGVASDGRSLTSLLLEPVIAAKVALSDGQTIERSMSVGLASLTRIGGTQVQDAGRLAESTALVARPRAGGYIRMLNTPSCPRCVILAGKFFRWNTGFQRHPLCDCRHIPSNEDVSGDFRTDPMRAFHAGQVRGLSQADAQAIRDGADIGQVVNATRGMFTANVYGRQLASTREGVTRRGLFGKAEIDAGRRPGRGARLRPESIYELAGENRDEALRLLRRFGYLI